MDYRREELRRAAPFVMAMLLTTLLPLNAAALFGSKKAEEPKAGAPIAKNMEVKAYRGVPYTGTLSAVDNEGETVTFSLATLPAKGEVSLEGETFVYTPEKNKAGMDSFSYIATDESGNASVPAMVRIHISRVSSGVDYADTDGRTCATAAVDLAEHGVFVGSRVGEDWFFEPDRLVSRGEFVTMAMAAAGLRPSDVTVTGFSDDDAIPTWAKGSVAGALAAGVVYGSAESNGMAFHPDDAVTLSEAAAVVNRILKVTDVNVTDYEEKPWYAQAVANLESVSIAPTGGFSGEALPACLTRAEAAELLSAAMALAEARAANQSVWSRIF